MHAKVSDHLRCLVGADVEGGVRWSLKCEARGELLPSRLGAVLLRTTSAEGPDGIVVVAKQAANETFSIRRC